MNPKQAKRRYMKVFIPSMGLYLLTTFISTKLIRNLELPMAANIALALIPALCVWWLIWGHGRYIFEVDEYQRFREFRGILGGVAITLAFCTGWGFFEMLIDAPAFPVFYIFVLFCFAYAFSKHTLDFLGNRNDGAVFHDDEIV